MSNAWHRRGASFEALACAKAPQDEELCVLQSPKDLILRCGAKRSLEGRTTLMQLVNAAALNHDDPFLFSFGVRPLPQEQKKNKNEE
jgi:hypothetical protein